LILWYEPPLSTNGSVQVQVEVHASNNFADQWNIYTGVVEKVLSGNTPFTLNLSATPVFITFEAQGSQSTVSLQCGDSSSLLLVAIGLPALLCVCIWLGRRQAKGRHHLSHI
jgi:hypothetical protein